MNETNIWYVGEARFRTASKLIAFEDKGALTAEGNWLQFSGKNQQLRVTDIRNIELVRQPLPWITYMVMNIVLISIFVLFTWNRGTEAIIGSIVGIVFANTLGAAICWQTKWVRIEHTDESGQTARSYFADGSKSGWGGIFGGTRELYGQIQTQFNTKTDRSEEEYVNR